MSPLTEKQMVCCPACDLDVSRAKLRSHAEEVHMGRGSLESLDLCCTQCHFKVEHKRLEEMALHCGQSGHQFHIEWESFILREEHRIRESVTFVMKTDGYRVEEEEMTDASNSSAESSSPSTPPVAIPRDTPLSPAITTPRASFSAEKRQKRQTENVDAARPKENISPKRKACKNAGRNSSGIKQEMDELSSSSPLSSPAMNNPRTPPSSPGINTASGRLNLNTAEADEFDSKDHIRRPEMSISRATPPNTAITTPCLTPQSEITKTADAQPVHDASSHDTTAKDLIIKQEISTPEKEEDMNVCDESINNETQMFTPTSPSPSPSPPRMREEEEEGEETPRARKRAIKHPLRGIFESGEKSLPKRRNMVNPNSPTSSQSPPRFPEEDTETPMIRKKAVRTPNGQSLGRVRQATTDGPTLSCAACNRIIRQQNGTPLGTVSMNGIAHAFTHMKKVFLLHCTRCDFSTNHKSSHKAHWKSYHAEDRWTEEGSVKTVVNNTARNEVVRCVQACYPRHSWNGMYQGINFLRMGEEATEWRMPRQPLIRNPAKDIDKNGTGKGRLLSCELCNQSVREDYKTPLGSVRAHGVKHALTHLKNVSLLHCTHCDYKCNIKGTLKRHWKSMHSEEEWREEGSMKRVVSEATKEEVVRCVQACFPKLSWNGTYTGINFFQ